MKREKLLLKEFIEPKNIVDVEMLLAESLALLNENPALFNSIHSSSDDRTYIDHAYKLIARLRVERDRGNEAVAKRIMLSLEGLINYFERRPGHEDLVEVLRKNVDEAENATFDIRNAQNDQALRARYMQGATKESDYPILRQQGA